MTAAMQHRLEGLEPDNLLAFLALLGLLRALATIRLPTPTAETTHSTAKMLFIGSAVMDFSFRGFRCGAHGERSGRAGILTMGE